MIIFFWKLCMTTYNVCFAVSCIFRFTVSGYFSARPKLSTNLLIEWLLRFILLCIKYEYNFLLYTRLGVSRVSLCIYLVFRLFWCYLALFTGWSGLFCWWLPGNPVLWDVCLYAHLVAEPAHKFGAGKSFDFKRATVFCFRHCLSKHKMTRNARNLGEMVLLAPLPTPMFVSMRFLGEESCAFFEMPTFFRPSTYFLWSNDIDIINSILFQIVCDWYFDTGWRVSWQTNFAIFGRHSRYVIQIGKIAENKQIFKSERRELLLHAHLQFSNTIQHGSCTDWQQGLQAAFRFFRVFLCHFYACPTRFFGADLCLFC